jgi:hypothetical protein
VCIRVKPRVGTVAVLTTFLATLLAPFLALGWLVPVANAAPGFWPRATRALPDPAPDPDLPSGPRLPVDDERPNPQQVRLSVCSTKRPVCVHAVRDPNDRRGTASAREDQALDDALIQLEDAYRDLVDVLGLPAPVLATGGGGTGNLDLYLVEGRVGGFTQGSDEPLRVQRDVALRGGGETDETDKTDGGTDGFDSAAAYCLAGSDATSAPARRPNNYERAATLCVGEAIAWRLAPSETPFVRRAYATHLWHVVGAPDERDFEGIDELQANPQRAVVDSERNDAAEASSLFLEYLSYRVESISGYRLPTAVMSLSGSSTEAGAWRWNNEPDIFDVLRASFQDVGTPKLLLDFAVARAFLGDRDDGTQMPPLRWSGSFGRVRFDWHLPWSSLPRHVATVRPIEPTGSVYFWLDLEDMAEDARANARLGFRATWEAPGSFAWSLVKIGSDGTIMGRIDLPHLERANEVETSLASLKGVAAVIVVGTNLGGLNAHPFDPDAAPLEPRGATVYLAPL